MGCEQKMCQMQAKCINLNKDGHKSLPCLHKKFEILTPDRSETMLEIFEYCKRRGWKCNCEKTDQQMQRIKTEVGKGWFSFAEYFFHPCR